MKISITRSFSKKVQLKQFEPIEWFCSMTAEFEPKDELTAEQLADAGIEISTRLDKFVQDEVAKSELKEKNKARGVDHVKARDEAKDAAERDIE